jgi:hypothetical protein
MIEERKNGVQKFTVGNTKQVRPPPASGTSRSRGLRVEDAAQAESGCMTIIK